MLYIDDFSTDNSVEIINKLVGDDTRFKVIKRTTKGGNAVKGQEYALPYCIGDYYFFLSQDDFIDEDLFEKCVEKSLETNADVVVPNMIFYYGDKENKKQTNYPINDNYNSILSPKEAFELSLTWQIHGFTLRKMELVKKVGIVAEYYNSCEFYNRKCYLAANKIAFANTNFYYRQDNPEAITKNVKYFYIDILTTDIMLFDLLTQNGYSYKTIIKNLKRLKSIYLDWIKLFRENYFGEINNQERTYITNALRKAKLKIVMYCIKYFTFSKLATIIQS